MRVAWLSDPANADGTVGGAELTQAEFRATAPVEVVEIPPDELEAIRGCDVAVLHNIVYYPDTVTVALEGLPVVKYWHDTGPHVQPAVRAWLDENATQVCCSPLQARYMILDPDLVIPPPVDLARFRLAKQRNGTERKRAVCVGPFMNPGKAPSLALEWVRKSDGIDFYGGGPYAPPGSRHVDYDEVPALLASYETFVHLPTVLEPFGRTVVEAWAAGCKIVTNNLVGAKWWIEHDQEGLETAAEDFWTLVTR
jgi:glycosyltransferase involved in cell wall biosynthesis